MYLMLYMEKDYTIHFENTPHYLRATYTSNSNSIEIFSAVLIEVAEKCKIYKVKKVMLVSESPYKLEEVGIFKLITEIAPLFLGLKCAFYDTFPIYFNRLRFAELVSENRGLNVQCFTEFEIAEKWLLEN